MLQTTGDKMRAAAEKFKSAVERKKFLQAMLEKKGKVPTKK